MIQRTTRIHLLPEGEAIFSEYGYSVSIDDEAAGEFVIIHTNDGGAQNGQIKINPEEWPALREAIDKMVSECRDE